MEAEDEPDVKSWLQQLQTYIGLLLGALVCSSAWILYVNRKRASDLVHSIKKMVFLNKIKRTLLKQELYIEYVAIQLKTKLGDGNFGEVYLAQVQSIECKNSKVATTNEVAIKKLKKG